ncbi:MAG TPA: hypothetical protein VJ819_04555, partial [Nocardioidaceae bacterium]|nr:hypothetical protein [Nocardioidaceae bacterium]
EPPAEPVVTSETGLWEACGTGFCLSGQSVDVTGATVPADLDGNGTPAGDGAELAGAVGKTVTIEVKKATSGWVMLSIALAP